VAAEQVKRLDQQGTSRKVVVADSLYSNYIFLGVFLVVSTVAAVGLRYTRCLHPTRWKRHRTHPGHSPKPRTHHPVIQKSKKPAKPA
jgi:hypothetical protein